VILQIIYGAFVSGLHAGKIANTFPTMDGEWIPHGINAMSPGYMNLFENLLTVQFIHRILAIIILIMIFRFGIISRKLNSSTHQNKAVLFCLLAVTVQFTLGLITLLHKAPITLAALHQAGGFFLFTAILSALYFFQPGSESDQSRTSKPMEVTQ
jgi:heme a synthase